MSPLILYSLIFFIYQAMIDQQNYKSVKVILVLKSTPNHNKDPDKTKQFCMTFKLNSSSDKQRAQPLKKTHSILDHMMRSEYEYFSKSSRMFHKVSLHFVQQFVSKVRDEIQNNEIYNNLLESQFIIDILSERQRCYINHNQFSELVELVLDYMAVSKNYIPKDMPKSTNYLKNSNISSGIASRWLKLKNEIYFHNKDALKTLQYICPNQLSRKQYGHSFLDLSFDLSIDQIRKVAAAVKSLCRYDIRTFCYLTNYLYISCLKLQQKKMGLEQIDVMLRERLQMLDEQNLPAPPFQGEDSLVQVHKDFKIKSHLYPSKYINLTDLDEVHKIRALQNYIQRRINEAIESLYIFNSLVKNVCLEYGYHFVSSLKLKDISNKMALNRVIQKIIVEHSKKEKQTKIRQTLKCQTIEQSTNAQYEQYQRYIKELITTINEPIQFKVSDLLRAKCMFSNAHQLNKCFSHLKQEINDRGYKIIELKNRLKKKTADILIKLMIQDTIAEIQLAIDFKVPENEFNHKIYELRRSQLFTPLAMLKQLNQRLSSNYFRQMNVIINSNLSSQSIHQYFQEVTYQQVEQHFLKLVQMLPIKIRFDKLHRNQVDINLMGKQVRRFAQIKEFEVVKSPTLNKLEKLKRNGEYLYEIKSYLFAQKELEEYCEKFKEENHALFDKISNNFTKVHATWNWNKREQSLGKMVLESHQKYLVKNYAQALNLMGRINTDIGNYDKSLQKCRTCKALLTKISIDDRDQFLRDVQKNIAWNLFKKGNYQQAIDAYQNYLQTLESIKGKNNLEYALILNNIGLVYKKSGNYKVCLHYFERSLSIEDTIKGKQSLQYSATLQNIGIAYLNQGQYLKSVEIFQKCLEIQQKVMGKDSLNCAETLNSLGNAYNCMGKSEEALSYYKRCLLIEEKIKGKQFIDFAMILSNIGLIYLNEYKYKEALEFFLKCLRTKQKIMGKSNIDLIPTLTNIGVIYTSIGSYSEALNIYRRCLAIQQKTNNRDNIEYSNTLNNIAMVEKELGNYSRAIELLQKGLKIIDDIEGSDNLDYAFLMASQAEVFFEQQNYSYSLIHYQISLQIMEKKLGRDSLDCANLINCIGQIHCKMDNLEEALKYSEQSLQIKESIKGMRTIDSVPCLNNIGEVYFKKGNVEASLQKYQLAYQICKEGNFKLIGYANACLGLSLLYSQGRRQQMGQQGLQILKKLKPKIFEKIINKNLQLIK